MTDLEFVQRDLDEALEAYAGAMGAIRKAHKLLVAGKVQVAKSILLMAIAADEHECEWSDVPGDDQERVAALCLDEAMAQEVGA